jgi:Helicase conserved C-terminal domain
VVSGSSPGEPVPQPSACLRRIALPGYAAALAALDDADLNRLLERRPDLLAAPAPVSFPELAGRAGGAASLAAALRTLDLGTLRLAELLAVLGLPTTVAELAAAAGDGLAPERLRAGLDALAELGIALPGPDGAIAGPPGLAAPFGRPGGLGPPVAELAKVGVSAEQLARIAANLGAPPHPPGPGKSREGPEQRRGASKAALVRAVSAALADPEVVARALAGAGDAAMRLLEEALAASGPITVMGVGYGRFAGYPDAEPATWLLDHGLLLPVTYSQLVVPREAALGLRGGLVFPDWPPPPAMEPLDPVAHGQDRAVAAATRAVVAAEGICNRLDRRPLPLVRAGTVAVRDLRLLARELDLAGEQLALLVDLLVEAGVLAVGGPFGQRSLGLRPEADAWLAGPRARRWADLAVAWRGADLAVEDHLAGQAGADRSRPLAVRRLAVAATRRRGLLQALTGLPGGRAARPDDLAAHLAWRHPMAWPSAAHAGAAPSRRGPVAPAAGAAGAARAVLEVAAFLGLAAVEGERAAAGLAAEAWLAGTEGDGLAALVAPSLPDASERFLVAGDLTVVAPGGLAPAVEARLTALADREASGAGTWRLHEASLRRAFDEGRSAGEVLEFLREHSDTPLPQALEYLVVDAARRHGRLRVGGAATYLRGDPALVAGAVRTPALRRLGLRELAPGVAVTSRPQRELLAALRKAGEAPLAEEPDGSPRPEAPRPVRHAPRSAAGGLGGPTPAVNGHAPPVRPTDVVARLRGPRPAAGPPPDPDPADPATRGTGRG